MLLAMLLLPWQIDISAARDDAATPQASPATAGDGTTITLGDTIAIDGPGAAASDGGVAITAGGVYQLNGTLADGTIEVDAPDAEVELVLAGASITSSNGPAIFFRNAANAIVTLAAGSTNALADGSDTEEDAALYSDTSLTIQGEGELHVTGNQAEGIATTMHLTIDGGVIRVNAFEDGLNANNDGVSEITINSGYLAIVTETGDGIDSNGTLTINGGTVIALGAIEDMNGGLDADGALTINGGSVVATGARLSLPVADSAQHSIVVTFEGTQAANTLIVIRDENDADILAFAPEIDFRQLLFSDASISDGVTYTVFSSGTVEGEAVDGIFTAPVTDPGTPVTTVTTESVAEAGR